MGERNVTNNAFHPIRPAETGGYAWSGRGGARTPSVRAPWSEPYSSGGTSTGLSLGARFSCLAARVALSAAFLALPVVFAGFFLVSPMRSSRIAWDARNGHKTHVAALSRETTSTANKERPKR